MNPAAPQFNANFGRVVLSSETNLLVEDTDRPDR